MQLLSSCVSGLLLVLATLTLLQPRLTLGLSALLIGERPIASADDLGLHTHADEPLYVIGSQRSTRVVMSVARQ